MKSISLILNRYNTISEKMYVYARWLMCPFEKMERNLPKKGTIVDVGCGEGLFSMYVALTKPQRAVIGIDIDKKRLKTSVKSASGIKNLSFKYLSATGINNKCQGIVISDAFHHFTNKDQYTFLNKSAKYLTKGGVLMIKEIDKSDFIRAMLSRVWDFILYPSDRILYWTKKDLIHTLESLGFEVKTYKELPYFPGSTQLYICTKK